MPKVTVTRAPAPPAEFTVTLEQKEAQELHAVLGALYGQQSRATYDLYVSLGRQFDAYNVPRLLHIPAGF